jgi:predicted DsbA family dithiol-disulfide isomerase
MNNVNIDIFSDVVCPWCYIGKRNLEKALKIIKNNRDDLNISVNWRAFQLNPTLPMGGVSRQEYTSSKFGGRENAKAIYDRVRIAAEQVGLTLQFDDIIVQPNSTKMHELIYASKETALTDDLIEALFKAFFIDGKDLSKKENIGQIAREVGMSDEVIHAAIESDDYADQVSEDLEESQRIGIRGVPFYVLNDEIGLSGAQPPEIIAKTILDTLPTTSSSANG